ncbi:hypothetical protein D9M71_387360 [compost metagenome]
MVVSIWLSRVISVPVARVRFWLRSSASTGIGWLPVSCWATVPSCCCGRLNTTVIGLTWVITTSGVVSPEVTRLPTSTWRRPRRPEIGARIWVNSRLSFASSTWPWLVRRVPWYWRTSASWVSRVCLAMESSAYRPL